MLKSLGTDLIVIVTGGSGFIGSALVEVLEAAPEVREIRILDIVEPTRLMSPKTTFRYCNVLDLACFLDHSEDGDIMFDNVGLLGTDDDHENGDRRWSAIQTNVVGVQNHIDVIRRNGIQMFIHHTKSYFETQYENMYSVTKAQAELLARHTGTEDKVPTVMLKYFNAAGKGQHLYPARKLYPLIAIQALLGLDLTVYGDGSQTIELVHVSDLAEAIWLTVKEYNDGDGFVEADMGSGHVLTVIEYCERVLAQVEKVGSKSGSTIVHLPMRAGETEGSYNASHPAHLQKLEEAGYVVKHGVDDIINEYLAHYAAAPAEHILNGLRYFQSLGRKFTSKGVEVDMNKWTVAKVDSLRNKYL